MRYARLGIEEVRDRDQQVAHPVRACTSLMRDEHPPFRLDVRPGETEPSCANLPEALRNYNSPNTYRYVRVNCAAAQAIRRTRFISPSLAAATAATSTLTDEHNRGRCAFRHASTHRT